MVHVSKDLIFDVGMHKGEDSEFYLKKGFRVVAVEAVRSFCEEVSDRFAESVGTGRLIIVNNAIADNAGSVTFFVNDALSVWGTLDPAWVERNARLGAPSREITVQAVSLETLIAQYGVPYYLKIDIEGSDVICLESLKKSGARPTYVSIESNKTSWDALLAEFDLFAELGYTRFKVVNQRLISTQQAPVPAREGNTVRHQFRDGSTGLFGEEVPGRWVSRSGAIALYKKIFRQYFLYGDNGVLRRTRLTRRIGRALGFRDDWYDTHAAR